MISKLRAIQNMTCNIAYVSRLYMTYIYDHAVCHMTSMPLRTNKADFFNDMRVWIYMFGVLHVILLWSPVIYVVYASCTALLYHIGVRTAEGMEAHSTVNNEIRCWKTKKASRNGKYFTVLSAEWRGRRPYMEDTTIQNDEKGLYGVFDGHGGSQVSKFLSRKFIHQYGCYESNGASNALYMTFDRLERHIRKHHIRGGSTGLVVQIDKNEITCCSTGDSEAHVMDSDGIIHNLSIPHSFGRFSEYRRYTSTSKVRHATVLRTCTGLMPTRTIGDIKHKISDCGLLAMPEIRVYPNKCAEWELIVLGTDGIFDCLSMRMIIDELIRSEMLKGGVYCFAEDCVNNFVTRLQVITSKYPTLHHKLINAYGGDNCSIMIIVNGITVGDDWDTEWNTETNCNTSLEDSDSANNMSAPTMEELFPTKEYEQISDNRGNPYKFREDRDLQRLLSRLGIEPVKNCIINS